MKKTGSVRILRQVLLLFFCFLSTALGADVRFTATVDRTELSQDESVALKLQVESSGGGAQIEDLKYRAPDFEEINEYQQNFFNSSFVNGRMETRQGRTITKVLRPLKVGSLKISQIQVRVSGKSLTSPDITLEVVSAGQGTPPPPGLGSRGGMGIRGSGRRNGGSGPAVFVRAEVDKNQLYKGEQVIVSYYLYSRVRMMNVVPDVFPQLTGFLREELEMPIASGRTTSERVVVEGIAYERALLVRYAAYPVQTGKLRMDSIGIKYNYIAGGQANDGEDEDLFMGLFNQMTPRVGTARSEGLPVEVLPLPEVGKPSSFTGAVGDFQITATADKTELRANEPLTVLIKVEGRGNLAAIGQPKVQWPEGVELYDSKGRTQAGRGGVGSKVFEVLLIPRTPGEFTVPGFEFSYFDPAQKVYLDRKTLPIPIRVLDPAPGSALVARPKAETQSGGHLAQENKGGSGSGRQSTESVEKITGFVSSQELTSAGVWGDARAGLWKLLYGLTALLAAVLVGWMAVNTIRGWGQALAARQGEKGEREARGWKALLKRSSQVAGLSRDELLSLYSQGADVLLRDVDHRYQVQARSLSRSDLGRLLVTEKDFSEDRWQELSTLLEYAENLPFSLSSGLLSEQSAREKLQEWMQRCAVASSKLHNS
jgi:hypothetical protein